MNQDKELLEAQEKVAKEQQRLIENINDIIREHIDIHYKGHEFDVDTSLGFYFERFEIHTTVKARNRNGFLSTGSSGFTFNYVKSRGSISMPHYSKELERDDTDLRSELELALYMVKTLQTLEEKINKVNINEYYKAHYRYENLRYKEVTNG